MRHSSILHAVTPAGLFLGSSLISDASAETASHALAVSVGDFKYRDTSNEPTDQTAVHEKAIAGLHDRAAGRCHGGSPF